MRSTRRDILKGSLGIAGILASGQAPAYIKSLIGATNTSLIGGGWENPYITDSLIAMWDGEWNAGRGVHSPDAMQWRDLVGNNDLVIPTTSEMTERWHWNDDSLYFDCRSSNGFIGTTVYGSRIEGMKFFEIVLMTPDANTRAICWAVNGFVRGQSMILWNYTNGRAITYNYNVAQTYPNRTVSNNKKMLLSFNTEDSSSLRLFENGSQITPLSYKDGWGNTLEYNNTNKIRFFLFTHPYKTATDTGYRNGSEEYIYCVRAYSRALREDEVAHNYSVDRERFGLS